MKQPLFHFFTCFILSSLMIFCCSDKPDNIAISSDGFEIRFDAFGRGKIALVFIHGLNCDRSYWNAQVPHFSEKYKVVTIDLLGHGDSELGRKEWTISAFGSDVAIVVKKLDLKRVVLIGHSAGGGVILEAAQLIPGRLIGLVGVDTFGGQAKKISEEKWAELVSKFRENFKDAMENYVRQKMFTPHSDTALVNMVANDMASAPPEITFGIFTGNSGSDRKQQPFENIKVPIRCINKRRNSEYVDEIRQYGVNFDIKTIPNVGHFLMMEDPETFNQLLEEIIQEFATEIQN